MDLTTAYRVELRSLHALLVRLGASRADLEDLAHDTFVVAMQRWATFDQSRPVRPWLLGIAWRVFTDSVQRKKPVLVDELPDIAAEATPDTLEQRDAQRQVQAALDSLEGVKRAVFVMHQLEALSVAEISDAMEVPVQTTYSRLRVAREAFAEAVRRQQRGER